MRRFYGQYSILHLLLPRVLCFLVTVLSTKCNFLSFPLFIRHDEPACATTTPFRPSPAPRFVFFCCHPNPNPTRPFRQLLLLYWRYFYQTRMMPN
ncbi:MAG: hypothetical protein JOS17DRAFT_378744 [Linnemannia elongata]|nr:MAG: hypothetical protein JOS17DRAFT_378744 [Linnemannia elongata]